MSLKNFSLAIGMSALGPLWVTPASVQAQDVPAPVAPSTTASTAPAKSYTVLLLTNGRLLKGNITEDPTGTQYVLNQKGGTIRFPKREAEKAFATMDELYCYKRDRVPAGDADEQFKLAKWCLEQGLEVRAREHLTGVLELSPGFLPAQRMVANLDANAEGRRPQGPTSDPAVGLASAEMPAPDRSTFDPRVARARRDMMKSGGVPVIFDLPTPIAVKKASEFSRGVHLVLQQNCASCHNEKYQGEFQLVQIKSRRDLTPDVIRANLDAVLPLVNRETPDRSELLAAALLPHGNERRSILKGPNDPAYQILSNWVSGLRSVTPVDRAVTTAGATPEAAGEQFGGDRGGSPLRSQPEVLPAGKVPPLSPVPDPKSLFFGQGMYNPEQLATQQGARPTKIVGTATAPGVPANTSFPTPILPGGATAVPPASPARPGDPKTDPAAAATPTKKSKSRTLDPALLEKVLKARQQAQP